MEPNRDAAECVGFPSPAKQYVEGPLDLHEHLIKHPAATFFVRANGDAMTGAGIHSGDILIVDRSLTPSTGRVVIAVVDGEFLVRRITTKQGKRYLVAESEQHQPIECDSDREVEMWGVATYVIHALGIPTGK